MKRFLYYISSRRFAIYIMVLTIAVILLSNLLPKPYILTEPELMALKAENPLLYRLSERFNVGSVTRSPFFVAVTAFLFLSISVCTARRTKRFLERMERGDAVPDVAGLAFSHSIDLPENVDVADEVRGELKGKGWQLTELRSGGKSILYGRRGVRGFWGSVLFHAGMLLVLVGALFSARTRFNSNVMLTERFDIDPGMVLEKRLDEDVNMFPVRFMVLESFKPVFRGNFPVDYAANIAYTNEYGTYSRKTVRVNEPLRVGAYQFMLSRYGFAPRFVLKNDKGETLSDDAIVLVVFSPSQVDAFPLLKGIYTVNARFFPDFYRDERGIPQTRSKLPKNPLFHLSIMRDGREVASGPIPFGGELEFGRYRLEFKDLYYWAQLDISRDSGIPFVTAGFFVIIAGLVVRLILNEKSIWAIIGPGRVEIGGRCRYFPALFENELLGLTEEVRGRIET